MFIYAKEKSIGFAGLVLSGLTKIFYHCHLHNILMYGVLLDQILEKGIDMFSVANVGQPLLVVKAMVFSTGPNQKTRIHFRSPVGFGSVD